MRILSIGLVGCLFVVGCKEGGGSSAVAKVDASPLDPACPGYILCGGDIVGTWHLTAVCPPPMRESSGCQQGEIQFDVSALNELDEYTSDGTLQSQASGEFTQTIRYTKGCLQGDAGIVASCADIETNLRRSNYQGEFEPNKLTAVDCASDLTGGCVCVQTFAETSTASRTLNYAKNGGALSLRYEDGGGQSEEYCVSGNTLAVQELFAPGHILVYTRAP